MQTNRFDAELIRPVEKKELEDLSKVSLLGFKGKRRVELVPYPGGDEGEDSIRFVSIATSTPVDARWGDTFRLRWDGLIGGEIDARVLAQLRKKIPTRQLRKRLEFLRSLCGEEKETVLAWVKYKGLEGLGISEMLDRLPFKEGELQNIGWALELQGRLRIISFSPLFLQSKESLEYLGGLLLETLSRYHQKHPEEFGLSLEFLKKKFGIHGRTLALVVAVLQSEKKIRQADGVLNLPGFKIRLKSEDHALLQKLENISFRGELQSESLEVMRRRLRISEAKLNKLLSVLTEKKKIIQGKDGFILDSEWLNGLIETLRGLEATQFTIAEFKNLTGLTRKYAIPLLELLDEMGVTRRQGAVREIIK